MKRFLSIATVLLAGLSAHSQFTQTLKDHDIFNHLGIGAGIGTTGISVELGTTITQWVQFRAGADIMPKFKFNTNLDLEQYGITGNDYYYERPTLNNVDVQGKITNTLGHFLFDIFPFTKFSSFHVTVGAYFGGKQVITAYNTSGQTELKDVYDFNNRSGKYSDVPASEGKIGVSLGDYFIEPDAQGNLAASIKVNDFRPYVGLGFGRIVPKSRINCLFDLGVQFWGKPQVWNDINHEQLTMEHANGEDGGIIKFTSKISVFPVLNIKIVGRIL